MQENDKNLERKKRIQKQRKRQMQGIKLKGKKREQLIRNYNQGKKRKSARKKEK